MNQTIRLSQCMIVKNEEKNIQRALSWAKEFAFEQIVVDTGSTDQTVEIATRMGANVFHFPWIDDFSAARNFAIDQANGNWIAFLDADEYFPPEEAEKLKACLNKIGQMPEKDWPHFLLCTAKDLDDHQKVFTVYTERRVFQNLPAIRYQKPIHEELVYQGEGNELWMDVSEELFLYHTGYSTSSYQETGKLKRNRRMLEQELKKDPQNGELWGYLGDACSADHAYEDAKQAYETALELFRKQTITAGSRYVFTIVSYLKLLSELNPENGEEQIQKIYHAYEKTGNCCPDVEYMIGLWYVNHDQSRKAKPWLKKALEELKETRENTFYIIPKLPRIYGILMELSLEEGNHQEAVRYGVLALQYQKDFIEVLYWLLLVLSQDPIEKKDASGTYGLLNKLYDFRQEKDCFLVREIAKKAEFTSLIKLIPAVIL